MDKPRIDVVFIGHAGHGKSMLASHLLRNSRQFNAHAIETKKERRWAKAFHEEIGELYSAEHVSTLVDVPGRKDFIKEMIKAASQADHAVLVVAANRGVRAQTKEHIYLSRAFGIDQIIVAINKMDSTFPPYSQTRYDEIRNEVENILKFVGYKKEDYSFVPVSATYVDNIIRPSNKTPWYKGPPLYQMLDRLRLPKRAPEKPFRWPVRRIFSIHGVGFIPVGKVETGTLRRGDAILFMPINRRAKVESIEMHGKPLKVAYPGDSIGIGLRPIGEYPRESAGVSLRPMGGWSVDNEIRVGCVAGTERGPPSVAEAFHARIAILDYPSEIRLGCRPMIHCHTERVVCELVSIEAKINPITRETLEKAPESLKPHDVAIVKFRPLRPMVIEKAREFPRLGRFAIRDSNVTIGIGAVLSVIKKVYERRL